MTVKPVARTRAKKKKPFDRYEIYEQSVQDPERIARNLARTYKRIRGRDARLLREDFCGTAANAEAWVLRHADNRAVGVDLDPDPIAWAKARRFAPGTEAAKRVRLVQGSVLDQKGGNFDLIAALNFSWLVFKQRDELATYFERVRRSLAKDGVFCLDLYGGADSQRQTVDRSRLGGYTYFWDQKRWEATTGETFCAIHFRLGDGRMKRNVFTYDWRLWTLAETLDLLRETGFEVLQMQNEISNEVGRGTSIHRPVKTIPNWESYVASLFVGRR